jgi:hypothetical protein
MWNIINPQVGSSSVTIQYKYYTDSWTTIADNIQDTTDSYLWDTTTISDGYPYWVRVILNYDSKTSQDTSNNAFTINNNVVSNGWLYGSVSTENNGLANPIEEAIVCALSINNINKCKFTDEEGMYLISLPVGTYTITFSKQGYETLTVNNIEILSDKGTRVNAIISESGIQQTKSFMDYTIDKEIKEGSIVGTVDVSTDDPEISLYNNMDILITSSDIGSEGGINITFSGEGDPGTKLVIYIGAIENPENIIVEYDGEIINQSNDVESFFEIGNENTEWILTSTSENGTLKYIIIVNIPHYSQHQILITLEEIEIVQALTSTTALIFYFAFIIIMSVVFLGSGIIRRRL